MPAKPEQESSVYVVDRGSGTFFCETDHTSRLLRAAYHPLGYRLCGAILFKRRFVTRLMGWFCDRRLSKYCIRRTVAHYNIDMSEAACPIASYPTFNAFFSRKLRPGSRPWDDAPEVFVSPADCRLSAYTDIEAEQTFKVKGKNVTLDALLGDRATARKFQGGSVLLCRLAPADYHRFHFPVTGTVRRTWQLPGRYESVHPFAYRRSAPIMVNIRVVSLLDSPVFGEIAFIEVGAFAVGSIVHTHHGDTFRKMEEKGYFKIGASAILVVTGIDILNVDEDVAQNTQAGYETLVRAGERVGIKACG